MPTQRHVTGRYSSRYGHTTADMMMKFVKFDDESKREKMSILNGTAQVGVETVFDHAITDVERLRLSLYARFVAFAHIRGNLYARAEYIKRLPAYKLNEVLKNHYEGYLAYLALSRNNLLPL